MDYIMDFESTNAKLLLLKDDAFLFTDKRYIYAAEDLLKEGIRVIDEGDNFFLSLENATKNVESVCIELEKLTLSQYRELEKVFHRKKMILEKMMNSFKKKKDIEQIGKIKEACSIAASVFKEMLPFIRNGMKECEIAAELEYRIRRKGAKIAFPTIVLSGGNSAFPHGFPSSKEISEGELLLLDFGVKKDGYCSDISRTYILGENEEGRKLLSIVKELHHQAISIIKKGVKLKDVASFYEDEVKKKNLFHALCHRIGHGVGKEVHEPPCICKKNEEEFNDGMVFTIEPGLYIKGIGGARIEDVLCIMNEETLILTEEVPYDLSF